MASKERQKDINTKIFKLNPLNKNTMLPTQRTFTDTETKDVFRLYANEDFSKYKLISDPTKKPMEMAGGTEVNGFYISAHTGVTIKLNSVKTVKIGMGEFYNLKEGEVITHRKYTGFKRFTKVIN